MKKIVKIALCVFLCVLLVGHVSAATVIGVSETDGPVNINVKDNDIVAEVVENVVENVIEEDVVKIIYPSSQIIKTYSVAGPGIETDAVINVNVETTAVPETTIVPTAQVIDTRNVETTATEVLNETVPTTIIVPETLPPETTAVVAETVPETTQELSTDCLLGFCADENGNIYYFYIDGAGVHVPSKYVEEIDGYYYYFDDRYRLVKPNEDNVFLQIKNTSYYADNYGRLYQLNPDTHTYDIVPIGTLKRGEDIFEVYKDKRDDELFIKDLQVTGPMIREYKNIVIAGDSYAHNFYLDEKNRDFFMIEYAFSGMTLEENKALMKSAFEAQNKVLLLSVGVNEISKNSDIATFINLLEDLIKSTQRMDKIVFVHSYMHYLGEYYIGAKHTVDEYDAVIRQMADKYDNVYFIDMSDLGLEYLLSDGIHYNKMFNDTLYDRMVEKLQEIVNKKRA